MKTIQIRIDEPLLHKVDLAIRDLKISRSTFIREALKSALQKYEIHKLEERHAKGYAKYPVEKGEFDIWQDEQIWGTK